MSCIYLPNIPTANRVVEAASPQAHAVWRDIDATGTVGMPLELAHQRLVMDVPHSNVAVRAAGETKLIVGRNGQRVAGWCC